MLAGLKRRAERLLDPAEPPEGAPASLPPAVVAAHLRARSARAANTLFGCATRIDPRAGTRNALASLFLEAKRQKGSRAAPSAASIALEHAVSLLEEQSLALPEVRVEPPPRGEDEREVLAWATRLGVSHVLDVDRLHLLGFLGKYPPPQVAAALRAPGQISTVRRACLARMHGKEHARFEDEILLDAIDALLLDLARARAAADAVLASQPDLAELPPPADEVRASLARRLLELRAHIADEHGLPLKPRLCRAPALHLEEEPLGFVVYGSSLMMRVDLSSWRTSELTVELREGTRPQRPLALVLALEAMLDVVREPTAKEAERIHDLLGRAPWERLLLALASSGAGASRGSAEVVELSWRLTRAWHGYEPVPYAHKAKKGGGVTAGTKLAAQRILDDDTLPLVPQDRPAASALLSARHGLAGCDAVLEALAGHPRVFLEDDLATPVQVERTRLSLLVDEVSGGFSLAIGLGPTRLDPSEVSRTVERGRALVTTSHVDGAVLVARADKALLPLFATLARSAVVIPEAARDELLRAVHPHEAQLAVRLPTSLAGDFVQGASAPVVRLDPVTGGGLRISVGVRPFVGAPLLVPGEGEVEVSGLVEGAGRVTARRDLDEERRRAESALAPLPLPAHAEEGPWRWFLADPEEALDLVGALSEGGQPSDDVIVEWPSRATPTRVSRTLTPTALRVEVSEKRDWLGLEGFAALNDDERVSLALLLDTARRGGRYVQVAPDHFVALSQELRAKLQALSEAASPVRNHVEAGLASLSVLEELKQAGAQVEGGAAWTELLARMRAAGEVTPVVPSSLRAELRPYQREGFAWLKRLSVWGIGAVLADDMGLGKTLQALAILSDREQLGPQLVVAPTSVCFAWQREMERFAPTLTPRLLAGSGRESLLEDLGPRDVVIASWGVLLRDVNKLSSIRFATFVMDEAQAVKNAGTRRAKAARDIDAGWRLALTGTPVENHLGELWSIFRTTAPGLLGSWEQFKARFASPIERQNDEKRRRALSRLLRPFLLRRTKAEVADDLPSRTEVVHYVELAESERRAYDDARLAMIARLQKSAEASSAPGDHHPSDKRFEVLSALTRLRLRACHPALDGDAARAPSSKLKAVLRIAADLKEGGHRALAFSQFTSHLGLVREALAAEGFTTLYLDGSTPQKERATLVDRFQANEADLFLISLKAGGFGLTLTAADYVLLLDPWWNPAVEDQAADRAHRIGQTRPVTIYRLVARGTIEESILSLQADKRRLINDVLDGTGRAGALSTSELAALLQTHGHMEARSVPLP